MLDLLGSHPQPLSRQSFTPGHVTASALLLGPDRAHLGLLWHDKLGRLLQPGGHVEPSDVSVLAAAQRELAEETGLAASEVRLLSAAPLAVDAHEIPAYGEEPAHRHFDVRYAFWLLRPRPLPGVRWVEFSALPEEGLRLAAPELARLAAALEPG